MLSYIEQIKLALYDSPLAKVPLLAEFIASAIDLLVGPITGVRTAHYWVNILGALVVAGLLFAVKFRGRPNYGLRGFLGFCFPKALLLHPSTATDIKLKFANNFLMPMVNVTWRFSGALFTGLLLSGLIAVFGPPLRIFEWNIWSLAGFTVLLFFVEDLGFYLCHLAHHKIPALWAFHKVHHSAEVLTPLTATRNHPVEFMLIPPCRALASSLVMAPALFLFDTAPTVVEIFGMSLVAAVLAMLGEQLAHSHIWITWRPGLQKVIMCPAQHQIHHSSAPQHHDKNMAGQFAFWDWIFGTLYVAPRQREHIVYGVYGDAKQPHDGLLAAYAVPFWDALRSMRRWLPVRLDRGLVALHGTLRQIVASRPALLGLRQRGGS